MYNSRVPIVCTLCQFRIAPSGQSDKSPRSGGFALDIAVPLNKVPWNTGGGFTQSSLSKRGGDRCCVFSLIKTNNLSWGYFKL